jgi:hypothetical protein
MIEEVDAGEEYAEVWLDLPAAMPGSHPAAQAETVKRALLPLYPVLTQLGIAAKIASAHLASDDNAGK